MISRLLKLALQKNFFFFLTQRNLKRKNDIITFLSNDSYTTSIQFLHYFFFAIPIPLLTKEMTKPT